jgi:hypothetical protein
MSTPFAWSYSRLKNYETCPKRHWHYDIAKDVDDDNAAQGTGNVAHKAFEDRIRKGTKLPLPLLQHEPILAKLAEMPGEIYAEQKLALTSQYKPVDYFGRGVWFRTVIDYCNIHNGIAAVIDYKTGKPADDKTQLQLMSATVMHYDQRIKRVKARLLFMNHDHAERAEFVRDDLPEIWSEILPRVAKFQAAVEMQEYPPRPGGLCKRYCNVVSCPYQGRGSR